MNNLSIMIVGVGGQGTLLSSRILGNVAMKKGYDVKVSEVHGMAQRGGSVVTYVKMGDTVNSPIIEKGQADIILAFEQLEALRWIEYLREDGKIIINNQKIDPMPVIIGSAEYPDNILEKIKESYKNVSVIKALDIARKCGNIKAVNVVMIGHMAKATDIQKELWTNAVREVVPEKFLGVNLKAFGEGFNYKAV